jgi:hypothetical protein
MTVTTHMCLGSFRSSWAAEGGDHSAGGLGTPHSRRRQLTVLLQRSLRAKERVS